MTANVAADVDVAEVLSVVDDEGRPMKHSMTPVSSAILTGAVAVSAGNSVTDRETDLTSSCESASSALQALELSTQSPPNGGVPTQSPPRVPTQSSANGGVTTQVGV